MLKLVYALQYNPDLHEIDIPSIYQTRRIAGVSSTGLHGTWREGYEPQSLYHQISYNPLNKAGIERAIQFLMSLVNASIKTDNFTREFYITIPPPKSTSKLAIIEEEEQEGLTFNITGLLYHSKKFNCPVISATSYKWKHIAERFYQHFKPYSTNYYISNGEFIIATARLLTAPLYQDRIILTDTTSLNPTIKVLFPPERGDGH